MAHDIFISYCHDDKSTADAACAILESEGLRCWIAPRDILPGAEWTESIMDGIIHAKALVLIFSHHSDVSPQVRREVERAIHHGIPVVPARIEDVLPGEAMEYLISTPHWLDALTAPLESHYRRLASSLKMLIQQQSGTKSSAPASAPAPIHPAPARRPSKLPKFAMIAILAALLIAAGIYGAMQIGHRSEDVQSVAQPSPSPQPTIPAPSTALPASSTLPPQTPVQTPTPQPAPPPTPVEQPQQPPAPPPQVAVPQAKPQAPDPALVFKPPRSVILTSIGSPAGESSPTVFEDYRSPWGQLRFTVVCPRDTSMVRYAFDDGAFFDVDRFGYGGALKPTAFQVWPAGASLHLMIRDGSGAESGPYDYALPDAAATAISDLKTEFLAAAPSAIRCYSIPFQWPIQDPDVAAANAQIQAATDPADKQAIRNEYQLAHRTFLNRTNALKNLDCFFVAAAPAVAVVGTRGMPATLWAVVKQVQIGTTSDAFPVVAQVNIDWNQFLKKGRYYFTDPPGVYSNPQQQPRVARPDQVWNATLPADATSLVMRFVFQDGTVSDAFQYDVDTTRLQP